MSEATLSDLKELLLIIDEILGFIVIIITLMYN
jgi:hypothetical protein